MSEPSVSAAGQADVPAAVLSRWAQLADQAAAELARLEQAERERQALTAQRPKRNGAPQRPA